MGVQMEMRPCVGLLVKAFGGAGVVGEVAGDSGLEGDAGVVVVESMEGLVRVVGCVEVRGDLLEDFRGEDC